MVRHYFIVYWFYLWLLKQLVLTNGFSFDLDLNYYTYIKLYLIQLQLIKLQNLFDISDVHLDVQKTAAGHLLRSI